MAQAIDTGLDFVPGERGRLFSKVLSQTVPGAAAIAFSALFGVWILHLYPATGPNTTEAPATAPAPALASNPYGGLFDPRFSSGFAPASLAQSLPLKSTFESILQAPAAAIAAPEHLLPMPRRAVSQLAESAPLPVPRPAELGSRESRGPFPSSDRRVAQQNRRSVPPATPSDDRTLFEKFFGMLQTSRPVLAYASPEDGVFGSARGVTSNPSPRYDRRTAVYDVAAHTVYMPNGTRLEAHSGLGNRLDDPRYIHERMRGATPPNVYELQPREQLFHGIQALRLIPVGNGDLYGRTGLLAHTYMLGQNGDSNGCVSFKNYNAFLQAFQNGEVKRLVVVARQS
ncbi:MAG: DUF2778 domain-containing protein [Methylocella sp.]